MIVYHGSSAEVRVPDLSKSREDIDFGRGFYLTEDETMAKKWACNKRHSVLNCYSLEMEGLQVKILKANDEWFDYCIYHRLEKQTQKPFDDSLFDIIIGPTANDKLFLILDMYMDGLVSKEHAIHIVNCMNYSDQIVLRTGHAVSHALRFESATELYGQEKEHLRALFKEDSVTASRRAQELLRELNGRK